MPSHSLPEAWKVLSLFLIPIGGGIPAGVLLAKSQGMVWPITAGLYFISDVILACLFEPIMMAFVAIAKRWSRLQKFREAYIKTTEQIIARYGHSPGPFTLILIAFGVDPMTGRAAALAVGHKFFMGWFFAIMGDMLYFAVLMVSTLWLNGVLGDGTWTTIIIIALMLTVPWLIRKIKRVLTTA